LETKTWKCGLYVIALRDLSDMCKQVPTPVHAMFQVRLLLYPAGCTDELQELDRGRKLVLLAVQVS
jgi:hypothetical protein